MRLFRKVAAVFCYSLAVLFMLSMAVMNFTIVTFILFGIFVGLLFGAGLKLWPVKKKFFSFKSNGDFKNSSGFSYKPGEKRNIQYIPKETPDSIEPSFVSPEREFFTDWQSNKPVEGIYFVPILEQMLKEKEAGILDEHNLLGKDGFVNFQKFVQIEVNDENLYISQSGFTKAFSIVKKEIRIILKEADKLYKKAEKNFEKGIFDSVLEWQIIASIQKLTTVKKEIFALNLSVFDEKENNSASDKVDNIYCEVDETLGNIKTIIEDWDDIKNDTELSNWKKD